MKRNSFFECFHRLSYKRKRAITDHFLIWMRMRKWLVVLFLELYLFFHSIVELTTTPLNINYVLSEKLEKHIFSLSGIFPNHKAQKRKKWNRIDWWRRNNLCENERLRSSLVALGHYELIIRFSLLRHAGIGSSGR